MGLWTELRHRSVVELTFANPPRNTMPMAGMTELGTILDGIASDDTVTVVVLRGATAEEGGVDGTFVAHADTADLAALGRGEPVEGDPGDWSRVTNLLAEMPQVVIAAIDGQAWGGGCEISLAATLRVASERAHLAQPEIAVGIIPGAGGTQRLPRLVGSGRAARMILTGDPVDASTALAMGLVDLVVPTDDFVTHVREFVVRITRHPRAAILAAKRALVDGRDLTLGDALALETGLFLPLQLGEEAQRLEQDVADAYARGEDWTLD